MNRNITSFALILTLGLTALLTACGGGGGGGSAPAPPSPPGPTYSEHLYVGNSADTNISQYTINTSIGNLTAKTPASVNTSGRQNWVAISPDGNYPYTTNKDVSTVPFTHKVSQFRIEDDGTLTKIADYTTGDDPWGVALNPAGTFLYVANSSDGTITQFTVNKTDGTLAPNGLAQTATPALTTPQVIAIDPSGQFLYVTDFFNNRIALYTIEADGTLLHVNSINHSTTAPISSPLNMAIEPTGKYLYIANLGSDNISVFGINSLNGSLAALGNAGSGSGPGADLSSLVIDSAGENLYSTNNLDGTISHFSIDPTTGLLTQASLDIDIDSSSLAASPYAIAISPGGDFLYATDDGSATPKVYAFQIGANGALINLNSSIEAIADPWSIATVGITR